MNILFSIILISLSLLIMFHGSKITGWDPFSPVRLFPSIWIGAVGVSMLRVTSIEPEWNAVTWLCVLLGLVGYLMGTVIADIVWRRMPIRIDPPVVRWDEMRFTSLILFLFLISSMTLFYEFARYGEIPLFSRFVDTARFEFAVNSFVHRIALTIINVAILSCVYLFSKKKKNVKDNRVVYLIAFFSFVSIIMMAGRFFIAMAITISMIAYNYLVKRFSKKQFLTLFVCLFLFVSLFSLFRASIQGYDYSGYSAGLGLIGSNAWFIPFLPGYLNISTNFICFNALTEIIQDYSYGKYLFYPIRVFLGDKEGTGNILIDAGNPVQGFITQTYMGEFYCDFGILGVFVGSFLIGLFAMHIYRRMLSSLNPFNVFLYSSIAWNLIFAVYSNVFSMIDFWYGIFLAYVIHLYVNKKST